MRNPTLADQYLYYNVGRAILLGNVEGQFEAGRDSLITIESFNAYRTQPDPVGRPEQAGLLQRGPASSRAGEDLGSWVTAVPLRRSSTWTLSAYNSWYTDFIGYIIGSWQLRPDHRLPQRPASSLPLAANASQQVRTQGANIGLNYYRLKVTYSVNYSYNQLLTGSDDPIIPAFNTPLNKFNVGFTAHDMQVPFTDLPNLGFGINWKYRGRLHLRRLTAVHRSDPHL
jgi:iron complex outermembrane receptor protein